MLAVRKPNAKTPDGLMMAATRWLCIGALMEEAGTRTKRKEKEQPVHVRGVAGEVEVARGAAGWQRSCGAVGVVHSYWHARQQLCGRAQRLPSLRRTSQRDPGARRRGRRRWGCCGFGVLPSAMASGW